MFEKDDKRRLYYLMDQYSSGKIDGRTFCDEYYYSYDLEIDYETLSAVEKKAFTGLSSVAGRFSEFKEDIEQYPGTYLTEKELQYKIQETQKELKE